MFELEMFEYAYLDHHKSIVDHFQRQVDEAITDESLQIRTAAFDRAVSDFNLASRLIHQQVFACFELDSDGFSANLPFLNQWLANNSHSIFRTIHYYTWLMDKLKQEYGYETIVLHHNSTLRIYFEHRDIALMFKLKHLD